MGSGVTINADLSKLRRMIRDTPEKADRALAGIAEAILTDIKLSFDTSPPGRTYDRGTYVHVASQPGQPPNIDTSTLTNSLRVEPIGRLHYRIVDGVEYGIKLEFGTSGIAPRPFVRPAFNTWKASTLADFIRQSDLFR